MARYLIVGAAGYVGSRLAEQLLARGESVRGLVRDPDNEAVERLAGHGHGGLGGRCDAARKPGWRGEWG